MADGRLTVRFSVGERDVLDRLAAGAGVETGALVREAALRAAAGVARDVSEGRLRLRLRSVPSRPAPAAPSRELDEAQGDRIGRPAGVEDGPHVRATPSAPAPHRASAVSERERLALRTAQLRGER